MVAHLLVQAGVVNSNDHLVGDDFCQFDLVGRKNAGCVNGIQANGANDLAFEDKRDNEDRLDVTHLDHVLDRRRKGILARVGYGQWLLGFHHVLQRCVVRQGYANFGAGLIGGLLELGSDPAIAQLRIKQDDASLFDVKYVGHLPGGSLQDLIQIQRRANRQRDAVYHFQTPCALDCFGGGLLGLSGVRFRDAGY